jgi:hypothetical protein
VIFRINNKLHNFVAFTATEFILDDLKSEGLHEKHTVATFSLGDTPQHLLEDSETKIARFT